MSGLLREKYRQKILEFHLSDSLAVHCHAFLCSARSGQADARHFSCSKNTANSTEVLHDPLRAGKVRALNEKPHQHLLRTEMSVRQCHSQFLLAVCVIPSSKPTGKIKLKRRAFLDSTSSPAPHSCMSSSYLTELFHKS